MKCRVCNRDIPDEDLISHNLDHGLGFKSHIGSRDALLKALTAHPTWPVTVNIPPDMQPPDVPVDDPNNESARQPLRLDPAFWPIESKRTVP